MRALPILPRCFQTPRPVNSLRRQERSSIILSLIRPLSELSLMRRYAPSIPIRQYSLSVRMFSPFPRYLRLSVTSLRAAATLRDASTISRPTAARADMAIIRSHAADTVTVTATASVTATVTVMDTEAIPDRMTKTVEANKQNISAFGSFVNRRLISYLFGTPCGNISFSKSPALFWYCASDIAPC